ncbi:putative LRR receptor-like serine/threonine-protein kinase [Dichanthelium oligosanthes]|uniref:Receptor kinase-like protein Xa21 n=1 Tax=Dichanthelium oligosanthes TaxID=888268 RepID=A0A1E5VZL0_9POAL|nr:putative LRR receptor-like serine/threonine-protein kinase [Dichanthelium oligosanthes]
MISPFIPLCFALSLIYYPCHASSMLTSIGTAVQVQTRALLSFKSMVSDPLDSLVSWNSSNHPCSWRGIGCGSRHPIRLAVVELNLSSLGLSGNVSPFLGNLTYLRTLDLAENQLVGRIPRELGRLGRLRVLNLTRNLLQGEIPLQGNNKLCGGTSDLHLPPCPLQSPKKGHKYTILVVVVPLVATMICTFSLIFFLDWHKKRSSKVNSMTSLRGHQIFSYLELVHATDGFSTTNLLGTGSYGTVYKGKLRNESGEIEHQVAIKVLNLQTPGAFKSFIAECEAMRNLRHQLSIILQIIPSISSSSTMHILHLFCFVLLLRPCLAVSPRNSHDSADKLTLLSFKSMLLDPVGSLASWNSSNHFCSWRGVVCGRRHPERVITLQMNSFSLAGRISPFVGNLSFLRKLDLSNNHLEGQIPEELGQLRRLQVLNLTRNFLEGSIPAALGRCTQLTYLNLRINNLQGQVPQSLANLSSIKTLDLGNNTFSGTFPSYLDNLPHLSSVSFEFNNLSGVIPPSFWNISTLISFSVAGNVLVGTIPPTAFNNLPLLQIAYMEMNQFHGHIPASLGNASALSKIQLNINFFSGNVPQDVGKLKDLQHLVLSENFLEANEPIDWKFMTALTNCSQLQFLLLDTNRFGGVLPDSISNLSSSLLGLYLKRNKISGSIPKGIANLINLQALDLSNNHFIGALPSSLGMLQSLHDFSVMNNMLNGSIPLALGNVTELNYLVFVSNEFSGTIPSTLGNLTNLLELNLGNNSFIGSIPTEIFNIRTLSILLELSYNKLEGSIPREIGNLNNLVELHLESNMLSGEIPATLGKCQHLQNLYLENNFFTGTIPLEFSQIKGLEILDLSSNNFSGQIPKFFGNLSLLSHLNLSFNNFAGEVPSSGVFANATAISIQGNGGLCGGIYHLHLPTCSSKSPKRRHSFPVILVVILLAATLGILLLVYFLLTCHKKNSAENRSTESMEGHPLISYSQLVKATEGFSTINLLGTGTFGSVFKGTIDSRSNENGNLVAVKVLKLQTPGALKSFEAECEAMKNLRHRNLAKIITSCSSINSKGDDFKAIVFDFMPNGSLEHWLHPDTSNQLEQRRLNLHQTVSIIHDVAYALDYLHWHSVVPIVHCDLKPSNVLLDAEMVAHVGDFGLARILAEGCSSFQPSTSSMGFRGTIGYAPPEYGAGNMVSTHGDIYSYGILILEMVTGRRPTDNTLEDGLSLRKYVEMAINNQVMDIINIDLVPELENENERVDGALNRKRLDSLTSLLKLGMSCSEETPSRVEVVQDDAIRRMYHIITPSGHLPGGRKVNCHNTRTSNNFLMQMPALQVVFCLLLLLRSSAKPSPGTAGSRSSSLAADELALQFVKSTLSDPAGSLASWNTSNHLCSWRGVSCSRGHPNRVVALQMNSLGVGGRISPFLGNLSFLRTLDLGNNRIGGRIPPQLGHLGRLQVLNLSANSLEGDIPAALGSCRQLISMSLGSNHLHGEIPAEVGALKNLVYLSLQFNDLSGEVPPSVANLSSIQVLRLGFNTLSAAIPPSLGALPKLSILYLSSNNLSGSIPNTLWNVSSLTSLSVLGNDLNGTMPPNAFDNVPRLQFLYMTSNQLHGRIPSSISNASNLVSFQAGHNYFSGAVPSELGRLKGLQWLSLNNNLLEAKEPKDWNFFMTSLTNCSQLQNLQLDSNRFVGELPSSVSNLSTLLNELALSDNQIFGVVPEKIGNLIGLHTLALESNNLSGPLPSSLSMLRNLQYLSLFSNNLWGGIQLIGNLTQVIYLYIGHNYLNGTIPTTLGNLTSLVEFDFSSNNFMGGIPSNLLNIPSLAHELGLSHNLLEGSIPPEIGNLKSVSIFHAESNRLSGEIPSTIGECHVLQNLNLQNNFLRGAIPQLLSELKNLQILDLSNNNLSGKIPKFLGNMSSLIYLNLSNNNFIGEVPAFGVFSNASAFSIHGNVKLCGGIFDLHLPPCPIELSKEEEKKIPITPIVVPTVATVSVLLFLCFFFTWNKKRSTRKNPSTAPMQSHPQLTYSQLAKATDGFAATNLIGAGTFSTVYKGKLDGDSEETASFVAIKVLKLQAPGAVKSFIAECEAMRNIRHRNLVKIITACSSIDLKGDGFKAIVFEFMPNGSLDGWLHPSSNDRSLERRLSLLQRVNILFDVAYALDYLHFNGAASIVHCDLKPRNVLLDVDMVAHVGDFGLAKILAEGWSSFQPSTSSMGFRGTIGYAPPDNIPRLFVLISSLLNATEYGAGNIVSTHGDIYSYGILVLEMITGRRPTDNTFEGISGIREFVEMAINNSVMDIIDVELMTELGNENGTVGVEFQPKRSSRSCM